MPNLVDHLLHGKGEVGHCIDVRRNVDLVADSHLKVDHPHHTFVVVVTIVVIITIVTIVVIITIVTIVVTIASVIIIAIMFISTPTVAESERFSRREILLLLTLLLLLLTASLMDMLYISSLSSISST